MSSSPSYSTRDYFQAIAEEIKKEYTITSSKVDIENQTFITNVFENIIATKSITITESSKVNTVKALSSVLPIIAVNTSDDITTSLINFAFVICSTKDFSNSNSILAMIIEFENLLIML